MWSRVNYPSVYKKQKRKKQKRKMFALTVSEFILTVDKETQRYDAERACVYIWPKDAVPTFEEAIQQLKEQLVMFAVIRGCDPALIAELDFNDLHHQQLNDVKTSITLMAMGEGRLDVTLKVSTPVPWDVSMEQHFVYKFAVHEQ